MLFMFQQSRSSLKDDVSGIIAWMSQIKHIDVPEGVKPLVSPLDNWGQTIDLTPPSDEISAELPVDKVMSNAAQVDCDLFVAPQALESDEASCT